MENDIFWDVFRDTGDPLCWLMSRAEAESTDKSRDNDKNEEPPRPSF